MQGPVAILRDSLGVGSGAEQEAHAVGAGGRTRLVQGCLAPRGKVDGGAAEQQEPQAVGVAPAGRDVQRCGELLLIAQRPQSCRGTGVRATCSPSAQNLPIFLKYLMYIPLRDLCFPSRDWKSFPCKTAVFGLAQQRQRSLEGSQGAPGSSSPSRGCSGQCALHLWLRWAHGVTAVSSTVDEGSGARAGLVAVGGWAVCEAPQTRGPGSERCQSQLPHQRGLKQALSRVQTTSYSRNGYLRPRREQGAEMCQLSKVLTQHKPLLSWCSLLPNRPQEKKAP